MLTEENLEDLLARAAYRTKAEVDHLVASVQARTAPRAGIRKLPERGPAGRAPPLPLAPGPTEPQRKPPEARPPTPDELSRRRPRRPPRRAGPPRQADAGAKSAR